jgi:N6-adenosine-specific RNA methylase IME4
MSPRTVQRAGAAYRAVAGRPEDEHAIIIGKKKLKDVLFATKRAERIAKLEDIKAREVKEAEGVFDVINCDPPWSRKKTQGGITEAELYLGYPTMTLEEIAERVPPCAADCHFFLWTLPDFLFEVPALFERWGLRYRTLLIWHKDRGFQPTGYPRYNFEPIVYATKGSPSFVDTKDFEACFSAPATEPSAKPKEFYEILRRVTAGRRLDMYNRRPIGGFEGWGNEAGTHKA